MGPVEVAVFEFEGNRFTGENAPPAGPRGGQGDRAGSSAADRIAQLQQLGQLKESGVLTHEELQRDKPRILGS